MKKTNFVFLLICCLMTFQIQAQITVGLKGGFTKAWLDYGDLVFPEDAEIEIDGFNISLVAQYPINEHFKIGIEPGFVKKGGACEQGTNCLFNVFVDTEWHLDYVELPVIVSYSLPIIPNSLDVIGRLGGGVAYTLKGVELLENNTPGEWSRTITKEINRLDYGIHTGFGFKKYLGQHQIVLGADAYLGMNDVSKVFISKNRSVDINIGYLYSL